MEMMGGIGLDYVMGMRYAANYQQQPTKNPGMLGFYEAAREDFETPRRS